MASALMFGALMVTGCTKNSGHDTTSPPLSSRYRAAAEATDGNKDGHECLLRAIADLRP